MRTRMLGNTALAVGEIGLIDVLMFRANPVHDVLTAGARPGRSLPRAPSRAGEDEALLQRDATLSRWRAYRIHSSIVWPMPLAFPCRSPCPVLGTRRRWRPCSATSAPATRRRALEGIVDGIVDALQGHCVYCNHCLPCLEGTLVGWVGTAGGRLGQAGPSARDAGLVRGLRGAGVRLRLLLGAPGALSI